MNPYNQYQYMQNVINNQSINNNKNLHDNLTSEQIIDYQINIDSDDRKIETYPDPFNYIVSFKALGRGKDFPETPGPVIIRSFSNIKYIKLDNIILSKYNMNKYTLEQHISIKDNKLSIDYTTLDKHCHKLSTNDNCYLSKHKDKFCICPCPSCYNHNKCTKCFNIKQKYTHDQENNTCLCINEKCHTCNESVCKCLINDRNKFIILKIKELNNNHLFSTNTATADNAFILYVDKSIGNHHNIWTSRNNTCTYPKSALHRLNQLSIEFYDNRGERLHIGIILQYNIKINHSYHRIYLIFGIIDNIIKKNLSGIIIELPITELHKIKNWFKLLFNSVLSHIQDTDLKSILNNNYELVFDSIKELNIDDLFNPDITNNVFFTIGTIQNNLNITNYE